MGGQPGNYFNHSQQAKALQKGPQEHFQGPSKTFSYRFKQQTKCSGCKMSVLCFFDAMPFLMELKDDDICGRGLCFVQCDFAAVIVKFAHLLIFLESF